MGPTPTEQLLRTCKMEAATFPNSDGAQKTPITIDQATKLLTMAEFGVRAQVETGHDIDFVWSKMEPNFPEEKVRASLYKWSSWLMNGGGGEALAPFGFQLLPPDSEGNTVRHADMTTDTVLNGGDWQAPGFNGPGA